MNYQYLLSPGTIGKLKLKNRTIMAPMSAALGNADGTVSDELTAYLAARAGRSRVDYDRVCICSGEWTLFGPSDIRE